MIERRQLSVASPISPGALASSLGRGMFASRAATAEARAIVAKQFGGHEVVFTQSGTAALVLAFRLMVPPGGTIGFPGYACLDLAAAARFAGVRVRVYDVDPVSLSADLASVERTLKRGVDALLVAHLFGYASDVRGVQRLAADAGVRVIEDAAQGAGGTLDGARLGSFGSLSVVSFGRGKGLCAAGGGAIIAHDDVWAARLRELTLPSAGVGLAAWAKLAAQWILGRPSVYALPAKLPFLRLGEMVYHAATEPTSMASISGALVASAFALEAEDLAIRRANARALETLAASAVDMQLIREIPGAVPGYLRLPVLDRSGARSPDPALGIVRPYPRAVIEQEEIQPALHAGEPDTPGAREMARNLFGLPVHRFVTASDIIALSNWMGNDSPFGATAADSPGPPPGRTTPRHGQV